MEEGQLVAFILSFLSSQEVEWFVERLEIYVGEFGPDTPVSEILMVARVIAWEVGWGRHSDPDDYAYAEEYIEYEW